MSNFTSDETFQLTEIAAMPRGMTLAEAEHYLMTDELPLDDPFRDISHTLTSEERQAQEDEANAHEEFDEDGLSDAAAAPFLSGESSITAAMVAAGFRDNQPRDGDGQWTDAPGSVATKSKLSVKKIFDGAQDAINGKNGGDIDDETASVLRDTYVYHDNATGLHTEITRITPGSTNAGYSHVVRVFGKIYDKDNKYVGAFQRNLVAWKNNDDGSYVEHDSLYLNDDVQGGGFAQRFNAHAENAYRDAGFNQIRLYADVSVGGYAWATQGYDFQNHAGLELALSRVRGAIALKPEWKSNDKLQAEFEALKARSTPEHFANGTSPKPVELAMLGHELAKVPRDEKHLMWPGKSGLMEAGWHGVKRL
jgi:hypothetical protein